MTKPLPPTSTLSPDGWCQRWRRRQHTWHHHDGRRFDPDQYTVTPISAGAARQFTAEHHYASTWPAARLCYGLTDRAPHLDDYPDPHPSAVTPEGRIVGVAVLSVPQHPAVLLNPFPRLTPHYESINLGRLVLLDPVPANSEIRSHPF
ncbi:hypothetical protein AB0D32_16105 [Micromonospora sp. NPDC048170]|uniref:hypothetical protein n=1 Tax=Micromonospora sp. NPDC048170 TaxID=3154819 RepID=UPI0033F252B1